MRRIRNNNTEYTGGIPEYKSDEPSDDIAQ